MANLRYARKNSRSTPTTEVIEFDTMSFLISVASSRAIRWPPPTSTWGTSASGMSSSSANLPHPRDAGTRSAISDSSKSIFCAGPLGLARISTRLWSADR